MILSSTILSRNWHARSKQEHFLNYPNINTAYGFEENKKFVQHIKKSIFILTKIKNIMLLIKEAEEHFNLLCVYLRENGTVKQ